MIKKLTEHNIYEVWNAYTAESVWCSGKPSKQDLIDICKKERWSDLTGDELKAYIKEYICVQKEKKIYSVSNWVEPNPLPKRPRGTVKCSYCSGCGWDMDDSYSSFGCPWCNGKGYVEKPEPYYSKGWTSRDQ